MTTRTCMVAASLAAMLLSGCAWLPNAGPDASTVVSQAEDQRRFSIVNVDFSVIDALNKQPQPSFQSLFGGDAAPPQPVISIGDGITIIIWETGGTTLFNSMSSTMAASSSGTPPITGSQPASIPEQVVQTDGAISVPFVGRVPVAGRTLLQVQEAIRQTLSKKASNPQVIVSVSHNVANTATVTGEVIQGARVPLSPRGDRILDVIAAAGGLKSASSETYVRLTRGKNTATIPFAALLAHPSENVYVWPGDVLTAVQRPRSFNAFGATGRNAQIPFEVENVSLTDALGKASGLLDERADPAGVFLLRYEPRALVQQITPAPPQGEGEMIPVIYRFDFSNIQAYFLAQRFAMHDEDIVYIANSRSNGLQKFFGLFGTVVNPVVTGATVSNSVRN